MVDFFKLSAQTWFYEQAAAIAHAGAGGVNRMALDEFMYRSALEACASDRLPSNNDGQFTRIYLISYSTSLGQL